MRPSHAQRAAWRHEDAAWLDTLRQRHPDAAALLAHHFPKERTSLMTRLSTVYPFGEIPPVGTPVTNEALADSVQPLLAGTHSLTNALSEVSREGVLTAEEMHHGLVLLAGLLGLAGEVMDRWSPDEHGAPSGELEQKR